MKRPIVKIALSMSDAPDNIVFVYTELLVHIEFPEEFQNIHSLMVRLYDKNHMLYDEKGVHCMFDDSKRCVDFSFSSDTGWPVDQYYMLVYLDGVPRREASFSLSLDVDEVVTFELEPIIPDSESNQQTDDDDSDSLSSAISEAPDMKLEEMVGLTRVKAEIESVGTMAMFLKRRQEMRLEKRVDNRYHMLFLGNPGTGKTTVAKLIGKMFYEMGLLTRGHTVEVNRTQLVGEYIGQTEKKTAKVIEEARGGVLFIDEAYALADGVSRSNDYGKEVIHALLPVLSEPNPDMIVILAGYEDKMKLLLESNQGLKERFPLSFHFDDYTAEELLEIALRLAKSRGFTFSDDAIARLREVIERATCHRDEHFGNGRWIHNLMEQGILKAMAKRVMKIDRKHLELDMTYGEMVDLFTLIEKSDVEEAEMVWAHRSAEALMERRRIGFARG